MNDTTSSAIATIPGPKFLMVADTGGGKTHTLRTLIDAGLEVCAIFTEPGMEVVADIPCEKGMHFHYIPPAAPAWGDMADSARKINTMTFEGLAKLSDINKKKYDGFIDLINACSNFKCDRCGKEFGPIDELDPFRFAVAVDSLSGVSVMAMNLVTGSKPVKSQADWGVAMDNLERFVTKFTTDVKCTAVMMAHLEREQDEVTGKLSLMASTLGKKLAPRIPRFFSDVVNCVRVEKKFTWSTITDNMVLKARNLPYSDNIPPTFVPVIEAWKKKAQALKPS